MCGVAAVLRVSGAMQKSAEVMKSMQELCKVSEVSATMRELSKEMMRVGVALYVSLSSRSTSLIRARTGRFTHNLSLSSLPVFH